MNGTSHESRFLQINVFNPNVMVTGEVESLAPSCCLRFRVWGLGVCVCVLWFSWVNEFRAYTFLKLKIKAAS